MYKQTVSWSECCWCYGYYLLKESVFCTVDGQIVVVDGPHFSGGSNTDDKIWDDYIMDNNSEIHTIFGTGDCDENNPNPYAITADCGYKNCIQAPEFFKLLTHIIVSPHIHD
eukprot:510367_1